MAELNVQFVRPVQTLFQGPVANLVLVTYAGRLGVYPATRQGRCLGNGVVRMKRSCRRDGGGEEDTSLFPAATPDQDDEVIDAGGPRPSHR